MKKLNMRTGSLPPDAAPIVILLLMMVPMVRSEAVLDVGGTQSSPLLAWRQRILW